MPEADAVFMARAVELAGRGLGATAPNPCVGAVLVKDGSIVAEGWHKAYGGPHAEVNCLADARDKSVDPAGCILYVTLEPCNHHGKTPPCAKTVYEAGVRSVVVGCEDPNPDVTGGGKAWLRNQGVSVRVGVLERECRDLIADFLLWKTTPLPFVFLKLATTLDGRIAARGGHSAYVSNAASRREVHALRAKVGAVMVGTGTLYADNPRLTARIEGETPDRQPLAVVAGTRLPDPDGDLSLVTERASETIFLTSTTAANSSWGEGLTRIGAKVWAMPEGPHGLDLRPGLIQLRKNLGCHHILCEGGGKLAMSLFSQGLVHELWQFLAPKILGDDAAVPALSGAVVTGMDQALPMRLLSLRQLEGDVWLRYRPDGTTPGMQRET